MLFYSDSVSAQTASDSLLLEFNMSALSALLKKQSEQNPGASYFNVDILKYQVLHTYFKKLLLFVISIRNTGIYF